MVLNAALRFVNCFSASKSHFPAIYRALCFVDVPLGQKPDLRSGVVVDFDQMCNVAIKPAIEHCALDAMGGDGSGPVRSSDAMCPAEVSGLSLSTSRLNTIAVAFGWIVLEVEKKPASQLRDLELLQRRGSKQRFEFGHLLLRGFFHPRFWSGGKGFLQSLLTQRFVL